MRLGALILITGIIGLAFFACAPTPPTVVSAPVRATTSACTGNALNPVPFLLIPFNPGANQTPMPDPHYAIPNDVKLDITAAFNLAPAFQTALCGLNGIFIDPTGCGTAPYNPKNCTLNDAEIADNSWGLRTYNADGSIGGRYVALSLGLWNNTAAPGWSCGTRTMCAAPFQAYQTKFVRALLSTLSPNANSVSPPYFSNVAANVNTSAMSVLAALAHERGHVLWYDTFVPTGGGPVVTPSTFCTTAPFYSAQTWPYPIDVPAGRWLTFGEIRNQAATSSLPTTSSTVLQLPGLYNTNLPGNAGDYLHNIYTGQRFASIMAAFSPDEDFVETYELFTLANAQPPLQSLTINIQGSKRLYQYDIFTNLNSTTELGRKFACFGPLPAFLLKR
jgi:hypothetical protein